VEIVEQRREVLCQLVYRHLILAAESVRMSCADRCPSMRFQSAAPVSFKT